MGESLPNSLYSSSVSFLVLGKEGEVWERVGEGRGEDSEAVERGGGEGG